MDWGNIQLTEFVFTKLLADVKYSLSSSSVCFSSIQAVAEAKKQKNPWESYGYIRGISASIGARIAATLPFDISNPKNVLDFKSGK